MLSPASCYVEPMPGANGSEVLHLETQITAQVACRLEKAVEYTADAYSLRHPCTLSMDSVSVAGPYRTATLRETLRETLETPDTASEVLYSRAYAGFPGVSADTVRVPVTVHVLYRNERGLLSSVIRRLNAEMHTGAAAMQDCRAEMPMCGEAYLSVSGDTVELRLPVEVRVGSGEEQTMKFVRSAEVDFDREFLWDEKPSLVVVRAGNSSLWELAKKYGSTQALIQSANPGEMGEHRLLLIPRAR